MLRRGERAALGVAAAIVLSAMAAAMLARDAVVQRVLDNVHWLLSFGVAAWLAWLGALRAGEWDAGARRLIAWALTAYAVGQAVWSAQVAFGWNPFPGPADAFFLAMGPLSAAGLLTSLRGRTRAAQRNVIALDVAGLTIGVLALTLALYLPRRGDVAVFELATLIAYPVVLCWPACIGVILALTLELAPTLGWLLFVGSLIANTALWLQWNLLQLDNALADGTFLNAGFSVAALAQGIGALYWNAERTTSAAWRRACNVILRSLPLLLVCVGALTAVLAHTVPNVPPIVQWVAWFGGVAIVLVASLRQNVLIAEHEALIDAERKLRETEALYRVLFDHATEGIFIADERGRYLDVNPRGAEMLKRTREEVLKLDIRDIVAPSERDRVPGEVADLMKGATENRPWLFVRKDKTTFPAEVSAKILPDGRLVGTVRDVSDRAALEAQLRQAQKMEAIGTLAAGIAHDFNNLIAAIAGNAEAAEQALDSRERTAHALREIRTASARATDLVRQIVAFSRPHEPVTQIVQLAAIVDEVAKLMRSTLPAGVELAVRCDPEVPAVRADASQVHQVLVNLATNGWQALEGRTGTIAIALSRADIAAANPLLAAGEHACVAVSDTGQGMDARVRERIFDPFFTTKPVGEGTGLGLAIVHRIVDAHHGAISVESEPGKGTTFRLFFPAATEQEEPARAERSIPHAPPLQNLRIFYVDDERALVSLMTRHLESEGHRVRGFLSSTDALAAIEREPDAFDVLVTDYNMPKLSGIDLITKAGALRPDLPFVLTSGSIDANLKERAGQIGVTSVLQKPYALADLEQAISSVAQRSSL